jgi:hypothetical protein
MFKNLNKILINNSILLIPLILLILLIIFIILMIVIPYIIQLKYRNIFITDYIIILMNPFYFIRKSNEKYVNFTPENVIVDKDEEKRKKLEEEKRRIKREQENKKKLEKQKKELQQKELDEKNLKEVQERQRAKNYQGVGFEELSNIYKKLNSSAQNANNKSNSSSIFQDTPDNEEVIMYTPIQSRENFDNRVNIQEPNFTYKNFEDFKNSQNRKIKPPIIEKLTMTEYLNRPQQSKPKAHTITFVQVPKASVPVQTLSQSIESSSLQPPYHTDETLTETNIQSTEISSGQSMENIELMEPFEQTTVPSPEQTIISSNIFSTISNSISGIKDLLDSMKTSSSNIKASLDSIKTSSSNVSTSLDSVKNSSSDIKTSLNSMKTSSSNIATSVSTIAESSSNIATSISDFVNDQLNSKRKGEFTKKLMDLNNNYRCMYSYKYLTNIKKEEKGTVKELECGYFPQIKCTRNVGNTIIKCDDDCNLLKKNCKPRVQMKRSVYDNYINTVDYSDDEDFEDYCGLTVDNTELCDREFMNWIKSSEGQKKILLT